MTRDSSSVEVQPRRGRKILRTAASAVLIAATFGFAIPRIASYRSVWASVHAMTWPHSLLIATAAIASMISYWITIRAVLPRLRMRQAAAVNLGWAVTYLPSIPLGALAILTWRIAPGLIGTRISHPPGLRRPTLAAVPGDASSAAPADPRSVHEPALLPVTKA